MQRVSASHEAIIWQIKQKEIIMYVLLTLFHIIHEYGWDLNFKKIS
jgi:hypothetical protein